MELIRAIVLGIVQGLTEFIPISSTAHLRLVPALFGWPDPGSAFTAVIQLGTLLAVLIYFRDDLGAALMGWLRGLKGGEAAKTLDARMGWAIFIGTLPIIVLGVAFKHPIETKLRSLEIIGWSLIGMGLLMLVADRTGKQERKLKSMTLLDGVVVGLWQAVALIPGASRSGSTITGGLFAGFTREAAARFSFLLSVPSVFAAAVFELYKYRHDFGGDLLMPAIVANIFSFIFGYLSIGFLIKFLQTRSVAVFVGYRFVLGAVILFLVMTGRVDPMTGADQPTEKAANASVMQSASAHPNALPMSSGPPLRGIRG